MSLEWFSSKACQSKSTKVKVEKAALDFHNSISHILSQKLNDVVCTDIMRTQFWMTRT
ncbi:hypothetical protein VCRA2123O443_10676 [Vibrio crassostreae]|nr:hypothetical protein VCRA2110O182_10143 [Vibrio crassostreae]CAK2300972.1 hypothetical protein VCRA211O406_10143 [Vibrio crassostreae]CAK2301048.1 hypothetical protein VCRA2111O408_10729 [Vibrio crassostreae]CAK3204443.1 hypothetical protein VCRA2123O443_10676 [Vibrio crassostreae]